MSDDVFKIDQFTVIGDIAAGQVSDVFEVVEDGSGKHFALKLLREDIVQNPTEKNPRTILSQFKQEFKLGQILEHPNLIPVHEFKFKVQTLMPVKDPIAYFTMDYFRSQNLKAAMASDPLETQRRLQKMLEPICDALGYVHSKGWVHRDVKPDNLLLTKSSEARVIDFSLACKIKKKSRIIQGTRTYIAPETIRKDRAVPQTDMYSLGVTLYEVLTGQPPFTGSSPTDLLKRHLAAKPPAPSLLNENVAPELDRLVMKLMAKTPSERFESMEDLLGEIRNTRFFIDELQEATDSDDVAEENIGDIVKTLDSRADAQRSKLFDNNPEMAKQYEEERQAEADKRAKKKAEQSRAVEDASSQPTSQPAAPASPPTVAPPQPMPVPGINPAAMMPGMPMMPGVPMAAPGMPMMPGGPMAAPGMPMMPGGPMVAPGMPGVPMLPTPGMVPMPGMPSMPGAVPMPGTVGPGVPMPGMPMPGVPAPGIPLPGTDGAGAPMPLPGQSAAPAQPPAAAPPAPQLPLPGQAPPAAPAQPPAAASPAPQLPLPGQAPPAAPAQPPAAAPPAPQLPLPGQAPPAAPAPQPQPPPSDVSTSPDRDDDLPLMEELPEIE